jgi:hypothetical protein
MTDTKREKIAASMAAWRARAVRFGAKLKGRSIRRDKSARLTTESIGFGLAASGGILALIGIIGILFVPSATFTTLDGELFALFGAILLVVGVVVESAA